MRSKLLLLVLCSGALFLGNKWLPAQSLFEGMRNDVLNSSELIIVSSLYDTLENSITFTQLIYDVEGDSLVLKASEAFLSDYSASSRMVDVATGDFNGDGKDEYVFAYAAENGTVKVYIPHIDPVTMQIITGTTIPLSGPINTTADRLLGKIRVVAGDFDNDYQDEFAVAYVVPNGNNEGDIHWNIFDTRGTLTPILVLSVTDETTLTAFNGQQAEIFDMVSEDFAADGSAELVLAWGHNDDADNIYNISAKIIAFSIDGTSYSYESHAEGDLGFNQFPDSIKQISLATGLFHHTVYPSLVAVASSQDTFDFGWFFYNTTSLEVKTFKVEDNPATPEPIPTEKLTLQHEEVFDHVANADQSVAVTAGDFDYDIIDEFVITIGVNGTVYRTIEGTNGFEPVYNTDAYAECGDHRQNVNKFLAIADMNLDGTREIVGFSNDCVGGGSIGMTSLKPDFSGTLLTWWNGFGIVPTGAEPVFGGPPHQVGLYKSSMALGDFDGDRVRLGKPKYFRKSNIVQPLVALNSPPIHFDSINGNIYDVSSCFNGNECLHEAIYRYTTGQAMAASGTVFTEWAVSSSLSFGGGFLGLGTKTKINKKYGERHIKTTAGGTDFEVRVEAIAKRDDQLYATVIDYDIWEFPVIFGDTVAGYILDIQPKAIEPLWFGSKSKDVIRYLSPHEVGNVLSYKEYLTPADNPFVDENIKGDFVAGDAYLLSPTSPSYSWGFTTGDFSTYSAERIKYVSKDVSKSAGFSLSLSLGIFEGIWNFGIDASTSNNYSREDVQTHEVRVDDELDIDVKLGPLNESFGQDANYTVRPYAYWSRDGILNLDYTAKPEVGQLDNWWTVNYGQKQDPAFNLPWRLDKEKGFGLTDPLKKYLTRAIQFSNSQPEVGDTITIYAIVNNYSLLSTDGQVKVSFYDGHPNDGGKRLTDVNGKTFAETFTHIGPKDYSAVAFKWVYPGGLGSTPKIFGYIDADNEMTEIHEDNNIGFNVLGITGFDPTQTEEVPQEFFSGVTVYPNPASDYAVVEFGLNQKAKTVMHIFDLRGQLVKTQMNQNLASGTWQTVIDVNALPEGIYFVQLAAGREKRTAKLVVLKGQ